VGSERGGSYGSPVKAWTDPEAWAARLTPEGCPFCQEEPWSATVELAASRVLIPEEAVLPGYVLVVSKRHFIEPYELPRDESAQFWTDALRAAAAVSSVVRPVKVNYEIHGNTIPHLHLHVFPRFRGDPFERSPIDPHAVTPTRRSPAEIEALRVAIAGAGPIAVEPMPPPRIRPLVIGVAMRDDRVLAIRGFDATASEVFYRPPGGGIEFGETGEAALHREFREELDVDLTRVDYLGTLENVFTYDGEPGHEIVLVYLVELGDDERLSRDTIQGVESDGAPFDALWLPLSDVRAGAAVLYPDGLLRLLDDRSTPRARRVL
jgi:diadenosine tetraphosphate (Ap4A) HIT family hydrolase/ADP-ribose pyrophosphatase YjhB (NUDIX family)